MTKKAPPSLVEEVLFEISDRRKPSPQDRAHRVITDSYPFFGTDLASVPSAKEAKDVDVPGHVVLLPKSTRGFYNNIPPHTPSSRKDPTHIL